MHSTNRHRNVFDNTSFNKDDIPVRVVGCGVLGKRVIESLAYAGVTKIHAYDNDTVGRENICNQQFPEKYIGTPKVEAIQDIVSTSLDAIEIIPHNQKVGAGDMLDGVSFVMVDSMKARRDIWEHCIGMQPYTEMMFEARLGIDSGRVYAINPTNPSEIEGWEGASQYKDANIPVNPCGTVDSIGPTADVIVGLVQWQFFDWYKEFCGEDERYISEQIIKLRPRPTVLTRDFR